MFFHSWVILQPLHLFWIFFPSPPLLPSHLPCPSSHPKMVPKKGPESFVISHNLCASGTQEWLGWAVLLASPMSLQSCTGIAYLKTWWELEDSLPMCSLPWLECQYGRWMPFHTHLSSALLVHAQGIANGLPQGKKSQTSGRKFQCL